MNIFYNKEVFPHVLFVTLEHQSQQYHYDILDGVVVIKNELKEIVGFNIFEADKFNVEGEGNVTLSTEQLQRLQYKLDERGIDVLLTVEDNPKFVVGYVRKKDKHPNADKLSVCQVDIGNDKILQIVCGAANVDEQQKVVVATMGAVMPSGMIIQSTQLRGVVSEGMLCSAKELGLSQEIDKPGILVLSDDYDIGQSFIK